MSQADAALPPQHQRVTRQVSFAAASQRDIPAWTSSGSSTSSGRTAVTWINTFATPSPPSKPESFPYRLGGVLSFPRRLFSPPSCDTCYAVGNAECGQAVLSEKHAQSNIRPVDTKVKIGKPRSFKKTPLNRVQLKEILENRYQPPLTRKEFTNYLNWEERSSENHFFYSWLEGYTAQYEEWLASEARLAVSRIDQLKADQPVTADHYAAYIASNLARRGEVVTGLTASAASLSRGSKAIRCEDLPQHLRQTLSLALDAFFSPTSHLQLNLDEAVVQRIRTDATHSPDPAVFRPAKEAVQLMLEDSLNRYLREVSGNASRYRSAFAVFLGVVFVLAAFVPFALALHFRWHRALRLVCLPLLFMGTLTAVGGLRRTCIVIFLFGTARQLRMFELEVPTAAMQKPRVRRPSLWNSLSSSSTRKDSAATMFEGNTGEKIRKKDSMATLAVIPEKPSAEKEALALPVLHQQQGGLAPVEISLSDPVALAGVVNVLGLLPSDASTSDSETESPKSEICIQMPSLVSGPDDAISAEPLPRGRGLTNATGTTAAFTNPWDNMSLADASSDRSSRLARSSPIFASLTKVLAPEVIRAQRDAIVTGAQYGLCVTLAVGAVLLAVPNP